MTTDFRRLTEALLDVDAKLKYAFVPDQFRPHSIGDASGHLLYTLALIGRSQRVLEVGTSYGYSTLWLAAAMASTGGRIDTIEQSEERSAAAGTLLASVGLAEHVNLIVGDALEVLAQPRPAPDLVLIDADKKVYPAIFASVTRLVGAGSCVVVADNMISHRSRLVDFVRALDLDERTTHQLLPVGKGLELCVIEALRPEAGGEG